MAKIYRIEHKDSRFGPLCTCNQDDDFVWPAIFKDHDEVERTDGASDWMHQKIMAMGFKFFFGATTKQFIYDILRSPFYSMEKLYENGYVGVVYETDDCFICDDGQVIFVRPDESTIETDIFTFFEKEFDNDKRQR